MHSAPRCLPATWRLQRPTLHLSRALRYRRGPRSHYSISCHTSPALIRLLHSRYSISCHIFMIQSAATSSAPIWLPHSRYPTSCHTLSLSADSAVIFSIQSAREGVGVASRRSWITSSMLIVLTLISAVGCCHPLLGRAHNQVPC